MGLTAIDVPNDWRSPGNREFNYTFQDLVSWFHARHSMKAGIIIAPHFHADKLASPDLFGTTTFTNRFTGFPYADFLLGIPSTAARAYPPIGYRRHWLNDNFFVTDDFKVNSKLTLNLGVRYEYRTNFTEATRGDLRREHRQDLANLYMNRLLKGWRNTKRGEQFDAHVVNYADDFVILSRGKAAEALNWTRQVVTRMGVTLNEAKTCIQQARKESFNFLGYTFGPHRYRKDGHWYLGASPSKKAVARIKEKVGGLLEPGNTGAWTEVRDRLNQILRGWSAYFSYGTRTQAYRAVDHYVTDCVRHFLRRRHKVSSRGTTRFSDDVILSEMGVLQLRQVQLGPRS